MIPAEGARRAALRWLEVLPTAEIPRARVLFTHHPDYSDLTPVQYAAGLEWLQRSGLVTSDGQPVVKVSSHEAGASGTAGRWKWSAEADIARRETGTAGEKALVELLRNEGTHKVRHVSEVSDAYGYDVEAESAAGGARTSRSRRQLTRLV